MEICESLMIGKYRILQDTEGYRFTSDSILLSRFVRARRGERVADFCAGSGIVGLHFLCLNAHISGVTLFEMQPELADMAARTIEADGFLNARSVCCRIQDIGREYDDKFSLVLCNPPYERGGPQNLAYHKAVCRKEITVTLPEIIRAAYRKLKYGGRFALINRADRLAEVMYLLKDNGLEPKRLQFVSGTPGGKPYLIMAEATKGGRPGLELLPSAVNSPLR